MEEAREFHPRAYVLHHSAVKSLVRKNARRQHEQQLKEEEKLREQEGAAEAGKK